jgi:transposase InsO family protein
VNVYPFIEAERAEQRNVKRACVLLEVSRAAFYEWAIHTPSPRQRADEELLEKIKSVHRDSKETYGSPRVHAQLRRNGQVCGKNRIARLMQENGIVGRARRRAKKTTIPDPDGAANAVDLVKRVFGPGTIEIDHLWCSDISYVRTWEGWMYLATVIDVASRRVVGWAMADHMRAELVCDALTMAIEQRRPAPGLIFHSDRGSQYTSSQFTTMLERNGIRRSLSRPGQCWDNAVQESFFSTLKCELIHRHAWPTRARARSAIFEYIEGFYNRRRLHSSLGYVSPVDYERRRESLDFIAVHAA